MEIVKTHLIFLWESNGPSRNQVLQKVLETSAGYYFIEKPKSGFFQITPDRFKSGLLDTLGMMPDLHVKFSQPREN